MDNTHRPHEHPPEEFTYSLPLRTESQGFGTPRPFRSDVLIRVPFVNAFSLIQFFRLYKTYQVGYCTPAT